MMRKRCRIFPSATWLAAFEFKVLPGGIRLERNSTLTGHSSVGAPKKHHASCFGSREPPAIERRLSSLLLEPRLWIASGLPTTSPGMCGAQTTLVRVAFYVQVTNDGSDSRRNDSR